MTSRSIIGPLIRCGGGEGEEEEDVYLSLSVDLSTILVRIRCCSGGEKDLGLLSSNLGPLEGDLLDLISDGLLTLSVSTNLARKCSTSGGGPFLGLGLLPLLILGGGLELILLLSIGGGGLGLPLGRVSCRSIVSTSLFLKTIGPGSGLLPSSLKNAGGPLLASRSLSRTSSYIRSRSSGGPLSRSRGGLRPGGLTGLRKSRASSPRRGGGG